uniref:Uncharacterized protein n=1 Tax=Arundo donax TaxID=35708 RepID=A0A0A8XXU9_ARUDO
MSVHCLIDAGVEKKTQSTSETFQTESTNYPCGWCSSIGLNILP